MITQDDLRQDPYFLALDALLNGPAYSGRADHARQILVDWLKACQEAEPKPQEIGLPSEEPSCEDCGTTLGVLGYFERESGWHSLCHGCIYARQNKLKPPTKRPWWRFWR